MRKLVIFVGMLACGSASATEARREVSLWVARDVSPSTKVRLNINTRNLPDVTLSAYKLDGNVWLPKRLRGEAAPSPFGAPFRQWKIRVSKPGQGADAYYSRQINLPPMSPGAYLLDIPGGEKPARAIVNVTNLAVVVKRSANRALAWVTDFRTGKVLPGTQVRILGAGDKTQSEGLTDTLGLWRTLLRPGSRSVIFQRGTDIAAVATDAADPDGQLRAHFQTDRPIYRPGQKVSYKAILRLTEGTAYRTLANADVLVRIRDPKDNPIEERHLKSNAMGSIAADFSIPSEGMPGPYTLSLHYAKQEAYQTFTVAEYRKPEFKVDVKPAKPRALAGEPVTFDLDAAYYFGAPVPQARVVYEVRRSLMTMDFDGGGRGFYSGDGNLYARNTYGESPFVASDTVYTDNKGTVRITVPSDPKAPDATYGITATVYDNANRPVSGGGSVPVYAAELRLGISTELQYATLGGLIPVQLRVRDLDGRPASSMVSLRVMQNEWNEKDGVERPKVLTSTSFAVGPTGIGRMNLPAASAGPIWIEATTKDRTGRLAQARLDVWVAGEWSRPTKEVPPPELSLRTDKRFYAPGGIVRAFASTNRSGRPVLLVAEGQDIWLATVVTLEKQGFAWNVPATAAMSPNIHLTATEWIDGQMISAGALAPIPDPTRELHIELTPNKKEYRPGDPASMRIRTTDYRGRPVAAEVALGVVDEAIYALSPDTTADISEFYWGLRPNAVTTVAGAPEEVSGGAYQRSNAVAPVRQRFEDTAFWRAVVPTDASGNATVNFEVPGNLTTWRATARGVTLSTAVGMTTASTVATRPLTLRLATPRQMVQGDVLTLVGTLNNRSATPLKVKVSLASAELGIAGGPIQMVDVAARSQAQVTWEIRADELPPTGIATLMARAESANPVAEGGDALQVAVPIVPKGVARSIVQGVTLPQEATASMPLPESTILKASRIQIEVRAGLGSAMRRHATEVLRSGRFGTPAATAHLLAASALPPGSSANEVREALALLSRTQVPGGWGWWEGATPDATNTAQVTWALATAKRAGLTSNSKLLEAAIQGSVERYNQTNLWEFRAHLAAGIALADASEGKARIVEVRERGTNLSPMARFRMAEALARLGDEVGARAVFEKALANVGDGPAEAFVPVGAGVGWWANEFETTAQALQTLSLIEPNHPLGPKFARWLVSPEREGSLWTGDRATLALALSRYVAKHPDPSRLGRISAEINGRAVTMTEDPLTGVVSGTLQGDGLIAGRNEVRLRRDGSGGEALVTLRARAYVPELSESIAGVRALRRFEVRNEAGVWEELTRDVVPSEPVRCTVLVWGDNISDAIKITEPIPAGFEFVDSELIGSARQEVRDGAVIHYQVNDGAPATFRYYLRAESNGTLTALPVRAEYVRRPADNGQSAASTVRVQKKG